MKRLFLGCVALCVAATIASCVQQSQVRVQETTGEESVREAHLVFVGDVMAHKPQVEAAQVGKDRYDFSGQFDGVRELFASADYVVGNLETTLSPRPHYSGYPTFCTPERLALDMKEAGFDAVTITNNHTTDKGLWGVLGTIAGLDNVGIKHVGARVPILNQGQTEPLVVEVEGYRLALLAYTYGSNGPIPKGVELGVIDTTTMRRHINMVRDKVDYIFALVHWGVEYDRKPNAEQKRLAEWMRQAGVDFVMGSHPHVVQPYEAWRDEQGRVVGGVYYSMGNFISNQNYDYTDFGLVAHVRLRSEGPDMDEITISADTVHRLRYMEGGRKVYRVKLGNEVAVDFDAKMREYGLVDIQQLAPEVLVELKYATEDNFVGVNMYGNLQKAYLDKEFAERVIKAQQILSSRHPGYALLIYDAARPISVQRTMRKIVDGTEWEAFVADGTKGGRHNYGVAVDLTIVTPDGKPLDMGAGFDDFTEKSAVKGTSDNSDPATRTIEVYRSFVRGLQERGLITQEQANNRILLLEVMCEAGLVPYRLEWWHYELLDPISQIRSTYPLLDF